MPIFIIKLIILQLYFKTLLERKRYFTHQRRLRGAIVIQKYCRGYIARMYKKKMIEKAVIIQSVVRTYLFRKKYITLKESAVRLQSLWRTKICVERYRRKKSSALFSHGKKSCSLFFSSKKYFFLRKKVFAPCR